MGMAVNENLESGVDGVAGSGAESDSHPASSQSKRRGRVRLALFPAGLLVLLVGLAFFYIRGGRYEHTDNAALNAPLVSIAANVSGQVISVEVRENQAVKAGDVLFRLDPAPYETLVSEAEARLADARANVRSMKADYRKELAEIAAGKANLDFARIQANRQKQLLEEGIASRSQYDEAALAVVTAKREIEVSSQKAGSIKAALVGVRGSNIDEQPAVRSAEASLENARLQLKYTVVRAPQSGVVTRVNQLQVGSYVTASRPVFSLMGQNFWIEANFKEDQLAHMRLGQKATISIAAYPGKTWQARITSLSPGTGNSFALLPAENATGNWVKVVQRLPIELAFDDTTESLPLFAGLSAEVTVDTGHVRSFFE